MQQNINQEQFTSLWGDYTINVQLVQDTLTIKLTDNKTGRKYSCGYTMENLPDRIKNIYETIEEFLFDLKFVLQSNNHQRFKIKNNGEIIFGMEKTVAGQKRMIEQSLRTQEQVIEVDHQQLVKYIQNFDVEKHQKTKQIEELTIKIQSLKTQLNHKHLSQINQIQELKRRITYLQTSQVQINALSNEQLIQKIAALQQGAIYLNTQLEKCIKKSSNKNKNQMNIMEQNRLMEEEQVTDMGGQEAFIDGFYLTFTLKNHCLNIILSEKSTADQYIININQQSIFQYPIESPQELFKQMTYIIQNKNQIQRISIKTNIKNAKQTEIVMLMKIYSITQDKKKEVIAKFYGKKIEMNQMEKLTKIIQLTKKELSQVSNIAHDLSQNTANEIKKWVLGQIKIHQQKQENYFCKIVGQTNKDLLKLKNRLLGIQETQGVGDDNKRAKNLNMDSLQKQLFRQNKEFTDFIKSNTKQLKQLELWTQTLKKKSFTLETYRHHLRISNILETQNDCIKLFNLLPKKSKQLRLLFKASDYNFLVQQFRKKCDNIKHTVTLIKTQYNMVIGGYTPLMWDKNKHGQNQQDATGETIIFSLTNGDKFTDSKNGASINHNSGYGPRFGSGADIALSNQCNLNQSSYANICTSFKNANYTINDVNSWKKFLGGTISSFRVLQYQVFQVIMQN